MDPFTALDRDWNALAVGPPARRVMRVWAERNSALADYPSPADLVAGIRKMGNPEHSCRILAHLLVLANDDALAARAVLHAVTPGLRRVARRRWRVASGTGPWPTYDDIAADTISAAWESIHARAGEHYEYPARLIVRFAEGRLRRSHETWRAATRNLIELTDETELSRPGIEDEVGTERQALAVIADAHQAGIIDSKEASILVATAIHGRSVTDAERDLGWTPKSGYRILIRARRALRTAATDTEKAPPQPKDGLTVELPSHSMTPLASPELLGLLATLIRRRAALARAGVAA